MLRALYHTSNAIHRLLAMGIGFLVVITGLLAGATWRLAQGPINLGFLSEHIRSALADDTAAMRISFESAFLAWEGFHKGADYPLDVRISNITISDRLDRRIVTAPYAHLTFSLAGLLLGRIVPRAIEVDHAQATVTIDADGAINLGVDTVGDLPQSNSIDLQNFSEQLSRPVSSDHIDALGLFDQIRRVHFRETELTFLDQASGLVVQTSSMGIDLIRAKGGRIRGLLHAPLVIGDVQTEFQMVVDWTAGLGSNVDIKLTPLNPAEIGHLPSNLSFLANLHVPISLNATGEFNSNFTLKQFQTDIGIGQGQIRAGQGAIPLRSGTIVLSGTPDRINLTKCHLDVAHTSDGSPEIIDASATILRGSNRLTASINLGLSQIDISDLPLLWPPGIAAGARSWVTENVTGGTIVRGAGSLSSSPITPYAPSL